MELREYVEQFFVCPSFGSMIPMLNSQYEFLGFKDELTDTERIAEYKDICQRYRKYVGKVKTKLLSQSNQDDMLRCVEDLIASANEYGSSRVEITLNTLRDDWLLNIYRMISTWTDAIDDDDYGWEE